MPQKIGPCTKLRQVAGRAAKLANQLSTDLGVAAAGNLALTALGVVGEDFTLGLDTGLTVNFARLTAFFATAATSEGLLGAGLNSFAQGNGASLGRFGMIEGSAKALGLTLKGTRYGEAAEAIYDLLADATVGESEGECKAE